MYVEVEINEDDIARQFDLTDLTMCYRDSVVSEFIYDNVEDSVDPADIVEIYGETTLLKHIDRETIAQYLMGNSDEL